MYHGKVRPIHAIELPMKVLSRAIDLKAYLKHRPEWRTTPKLTLHTLSPKQRCVQKAQNMMTMMFWHRQPMVTPKSNIGIWIESLVMKDQRQRTVQQASVNHVSNAELQKARNGLTTMLVNRRSRITSKTRVNSRTVRHRQVLWARSKSLLSILMTKRLREITSENALVN